MSFGLLPFDHYDRTMRAGDGAVRAAAGRLDASKLALARESMMMDEAYRRDALAQDLQLGNRRIDAANPRPSTGDRIIGGLGGAFTGYMMGSALGGQGGSAMWGYGGAALGALGGFL